MRSKNKLTSKKSYLDLVKSKDDGEGGGGKGRSVRKQVFQFLFLLFSADFDVSSEFRLPFTTLLKYLAP